jgi:hypothetical protein
MYLLITKINNVFRLSKYTYDSPAATHVDKTVIYVIFSFKLLKIVTCSETLYFRSSDHPIDLNVLFVKLVAIIFFVSYPVIYSNTERFKGHVLVRVSSLIFIQVKIWVHVVEC